MQVKHHSPLSGVTGDAAPSSCYVEKTTFQMLQPKPGYKPEPFGGDIKWPTGKIYGEISAQTPWGEQYTGLIQNNYPFIHKGFVYGDQGSAYMVEMRATHGVFIENSAYFLPTGNLIIPLHSSAFPSELN